MCSAALTPQVAEARRVLLEHRPPSTVVVVGRDVGRAEESLLVTTLGDLDPSSIDMKCLLVIGSSSTRVTASGAVWTPRSTPGGTQDTGSGTGEDALEKPQRLVERSRAGS